MTRGSWARSAARPTARSVRPCGSWAASVARARAAWDGLAGGPRDESALFGAVYSDVAAAAILSTALGLWSDTAAALGDDGLDETADMGTD